MKPDKVRSNNTFIEHFSKGSLINFVRFSSDIENELEPLCVNGKIITITFSTQKALYKITKEDLNWSFVDIEVARDLVRLGLFHLHKQVVIKFQSTDVVSIALYVRP